MATESRSHNGCWTCRLRKKKCDEKRPVCAECSVLGLECRGFGKRPSWMDRGPKQRIETLKVKKRVAERMAEKRMEQINQNYASPIRNPKNDSQRREAPGHSVDLVPITTYHTSSSQEKPVHDTGTHLSGWDSFSSTSFSTVQPSLESDDPSIWLDNIGCFTQHNILPLSNAELNPIETDICLPEFDWYLPSLPALDVSCQSTTCSPATTKLPGANHVQSTKESGLMVADIEEALLLAHYLGEVFDWQFRFGSSYGGLEKGYVLWLISQSRPLYLASLALSDSHRSISRKTQQKSEASREPSFRYNQALDSFNCTLPANGYTKDLASLASAINFIHLGILQCRMIDWRTHLETATSIISPWILARSNHPQVKQVGDQANIDEKSIKFLIAYIIHLVVMSSLTRLSLPAVCGNYMAFLQDSASGIDMESVNGCQTWVHVAILQIYELRDWKKRMKTFSPWELVSKASSIQQGLEENIASNLRQLSQRKRDLEQMLDHSELTSRAKYDYHICTITHVYASSVSVLLEVVVSGPHPELQEMKEKVDRALKAYEYIDDSSFLRMFRWPLCVTGCMSQSRQQEFLRNLMSFRGASDMRDLDDILEILEKVWEITANCGLGEDGFDYAKLENFISPNIFVA